MWSSFVNVRREWCIIVVTNISNEGIRAIFALKKNRLIEQPIYHFFGTAVLNVFHILQDCHCFNSMKQVQGTMTLTNTLQKKNENYSELLDFLFLMFKFIIFYENCYECCIIILLLNIELLMAFIATQYN